MPKKGGRRRKRRTHEAHLKSKEGTAGSGKVAAQAVADAKVPRSFVVRKPGGKIGKSALQLITDLRKMMLPNTALNLREHKKAKLQDYVSVAGPLGVSHMMVVSQTKLGPLLRVARLPKGPTLTFKLEEYALMKHVRASQRRPIDPTSAFKSNPIVVLNNFGEAVKEGDEASNGDSAGEPLRQNKIAMLMFQGMFPAINVQTIKINDCRRVVLIHRDEATGSFELRHYLVKARPKGVSKQVRTLLEGKSIPDLGHMDDIMDYVTGKQKARNSGYATSDSEFEDEDACVTLPQDFKAGGAGNKKNTQSFVKLREIGPRMNLSLLKIEDDAFSGEVQYHSYIEKTETEVEEQRRVHAERAALKKKRQDEQDANVKRKREAEEIKREKKAEKRRRREARRSEERDSSGSESNGGEDGDADDDADEQE